MPLTTIQTSAEAEDLYPANEAKHIIIGVIGTMVQLEVVDAINGNKHVNFTIPEFNVFAADVQRVRAAIQ